MSVFFKALEQAERDRHARSQPHPFETQLEPEPPPAARGAVDTDAAELFREAPVAVAAPGRSRLLDEDVLPDAVAAPWRDVAGELVSLLRPSSPEAEQYRTLRHTLQHLHQTTGLTVIAVSSPGPGDGRTVTAINVAGALAQVPDTRVLLVDLDLRHGDLAQRLGGPPSAAPGMVDAILNHDLELEDVVQRYAAYNLSVVPAGSLPPRPDEIVTAPRLGALLEGARRRYDYVVVDTPPILPALDARAIGQWVDGFLLVVAAHRTPRRLLGEALSLLQPAQMVGVVFHR